jgi:glycosyltransferase involved in cell wall biosynthesis
VRIGIIGKYPPIQGGVSMRTYRVAHALAAQGHEVHVVTNAKEVQGPFRMHMRPEDWARCEARHAAGSVSVHWTEPADRSQSYIPMASPYVSKLATIAARVHAERPLDVLYSHYLEPYGVAACLAGQMTGVPHVARMAGSDAGRLWRHPQLELLYDHVLRSAELVIAAGQVAERAIEHGVDPARIAAGGQLALPEELFDPDGPPLDLAALRAEIERDPEARDQAWGGFAGRCPYFGIYGKLGDTKGSFALLAAMRRLERAGLEIGLVALAHGPEGIEQRFRSRTRKLGLADRVLQLPFLPHWRVPEFLRGCLAVCCLEQDFPIGIHTPITPFETLLCGSCLVASTEVIRKLPGYARLVHGYGCVAIADVNDIAGLSSRLGAIVRDPRPAAAVGARGRKFARELQREADFPHTLECVLEAAAARQRAPVMGRPPPRDAVDLPEHDELTFTRMAEAALHAGSNGAEGCQGKTIGAPAPPGKILAELEQAVGMGRVRLKPLLAAVAIESRIAAARSEMANLADRRDPLFRLRLRRWAMAEDDLAGLIALRSPDLRVLEFELDVSELAGARTPAELPASPSPQPSWMIVFAPDAADGRGPLVVDRATARILELCDGTRTVLQIAGELGDEARRGIEENLAWIENLFVHGLISLEEAISPCPDRVRTRSVNLSRDDAAASPPPHSASKTRVNALVPGEGQGGGAR